MAPKSESGSEVIDLDKMIDHAQSNCFTTSAAASYKGKSRWSAKDGFLVALLAIISVCCILVVGELGAILSTQGGSGPVIINTGEGSSYTVDKGAIDSVPDEVPAELGAALSGDNVCEAKKIDLPNIECVIDAMTNVGPQAGADVTKGYQGKMNTTVVPITNEYWKNAMCPVNVHWHLGAEHRSAGQYDENGSGPSKRRQLAADARQGFQCSLYDGNDAKFTKAYEWKHCVDMKVGETYEVHWPHSAAGACGTPNQYQTPFYDGVFCNLNEEALATLQPQDIANAVGVQAQVFTIVNDERYFYPNLMRGMIVDGEMGTDLAKYTGSTTGDKRDNEICSQYSPITWQVDRKCHLISASTFDKMCADMKMQRDDMTDDLYAHGSRELVDDMLAANNHQNRKLRGH